MLAHTIEEVKPFMQEFLSGTAFDRFYLCEASIITGNTYHIDGHIQKDFYDHEDPRNTGAQGYQYWEEIKPIIFSMIKGQRSPLGMKIVLMLAPHNVDRFIKRYNLPLSPEQITGLYLNIRYEQQKLFISSGTALSIFTLDKTVEHMWDEMLLQFFAKHNITLVAMS